MGRNATVAAVTTHRRLIVVAGVVALTALGVALVWLYLANEPRVDLHRVLDLFGRYGYLVVFVPVLLETAGVPLPGETVLLLAGVASAQGRIDLVWTIVVGATAAILGDNLGYAIGRYGGRRLVDRLAEMGRLQRSLARGEAYFERRGGPAVFFARWLPGLRIFGAWIAGLTRMPWPRFLVWNAAGGICWATTVVLAGHLFGHSLHRVEQVFGIGGVVVVVMAAIALLVLWRRRERDIEERL
jgi:membrane protein DedA with SNARE-associated domain